MLNVSKLCSGYGAIQAVKEVDLDVESGRLVTLIGPNGAGKSTFVNTVVGLHPASSGDVVFNGTALTNKAAHVRIRSGMGLVPEGRQVIATLTVSENLRLASYGVGGADADPVWDLDAVFELFPRLDERRSQLAGSLSGGEQQMLAVARALLTDPKLLVLDEPSMGLAPSLVDAVMEAIAKIHSRGTSVLLIEQNVSLALSVADYAYVMQRGCIMLQGTPRELQSSPEVMSAYLG